MLRWILGDMLALMALAAFLGTLFIVTGVI